MPIEVASARRGLISFVRQHPIAVFVVLAYAFSWWPWIWFQIDPIAAESPIVPFGPLFAALAVLAMMGGWTSVKSLLARCLRWRIGLGWYAISLLLPLATTLIAIAINLQWGALQAETFLHPSLGDLAGRFVFIFIAIGMGEEIAWRGFLLDRLLTSHTVLKATLLVALTHLIWHAPLFGVEYHFSNIVPWAATVICFSFIMSWIYLRSGKSLLPSMLGHSVVNTVGVQFGMFQGADLTRLWWIWGALWVLATIAVVGFSGRQFWLGKAMQN